MIRQAIHRLNRSFPSLNLKLEVDANRRHADLVLPGLRYDDIDISGKPDLLRIYKMIYRVELAAFFHENPFLDFSKLVNQQITAIIRASQVELRKDFYERTVAKAPLSVNLRVVNVGDATFTTVTDFSCGGKMKPSVKVTNVHALVDLNTGKVIPAPDWWRNKYKVGLPDRPPYIKPPVQPSGDGMHSHSFTVPYSDLDVYGRTSTSSYIKYLLDTASIAAHEGYFRKVTNTVLVQEHPIKKISMLFYDSSHLGDSLVTEMWEDRASDREEIYCQVSKDNKALWQGLLEYHPSERTEDIN